MRPELCKAGHPLTPDNTYTNGRGGVTCKICKRIGGKNAYVQWVGIQMHGWNLRSQRDWYQKDAAPVEVTDFFKTGT